MKAQRISLAISLSASLAATACVPDDLDGGDADTSAAWSPPPDGTRGTMRVRSARTGAVQEVKYTAHHGHAFWEGDIDLGPIPNPANRSIGIKGIDERWPDGLIHYAWDANIDDDTRVAIITAISTWQDSVPALQFVPGFDPNHPFMHFIYSDEDFNYTDGEGPNGIDAGDETLVHLTPNPGRSTNTTPPMRAS